MTIKANYKLSFLRRNLKGCPEKLKQTAYFSLIRSYMEYGATVWDPYQKYNSDKVEMVQRRAARFSQSRYSRYSSVSDMLDVLGWTPLSQKRQEARLILFHKIINGLVHVPFEGVHVEAYKGTRRKHNMKFRQIGHTTSQYRQSFFPKTIRAWNGLAFAEAPSLAVFRRKKLICPHNFIIIFDKGVGSQSVTVFGDIKFLGSYWNTLEFPFRESSIII